MRQCEPGPRRGCQVGDLAAAVPCGMGSRGPRSRCPPACRRPRTRRTLWRWSRVADRPGVPTAAAFGPGQSWRAAPVRQLRRRQRMIRVAVEGHPPADNLCSSSGSRGAVISTVNPKRSAAAVGAHLPQGSSFRSRSTGRRAQPRRRPARQSSDPSPPHPAAGPQMIMKHSPRPHRESRGEPRPASRARRPPRRRQGLPQIERADHRSSVAPTGSSTNLAGRERATG